MEKRKGIKQLGMSGLDAPTIDNTAAVSITQDGLFIKGSDEIDRRTISKISISGQSYDINIPSVNEEIKKYGIGLICKFLLFITVQTVVQH